MEDANQLAARWGVPVSIAFLAIAVRILLSADRMTLLGLFRGLAVGALVGWIAIVWVWELESLSLGMRGCIIGVSATLAEDVVVGLLAIGKKIRNDPAAFIDIIINWRSNWRNKP